MKTIGELVCKQIEHVRVVSKSGEQHQGLPGAAPVQHLQLHIGLDRDETHFVTGSIEAADIVRTNHASWVSQSVDTRQRGVPNIAAESSSGKKASQKARGDQEPGLPVCHDFGPPTAPWYYYLLCRWSAFFRAGS